MKTNWKMLGLVFLLSYVPIVLWLIFYILFSDSYLPILILAIYFIILYIVTKVIGKRNASINEMNKALFTSNYYIKDRITKVKILYYMPSLIMLLLFFIVEFTGNIGDKSIGNTGFMLMILLLLMVIYRLFIEFTKFDFENKQ
ncbi:hypothetical protein [Apilactobacillus quenuiae]|uniref:hypothetical protein n=1 Tax=Apilactobacillus quenuiae TaxID=2008377 RepID=UPI000D014BFE|nr:hypothetical protein [Apilactobacillus quenuiae]